MMTRRPVIAAILICMFFEASTLLFCEEKKELPPKPITAKEMTKDEILSELKENLEEEEELFDFIPELKKKKNEKEGSYFYTYQDVKLEDLDKEKLEKILQRVHNQLTIIRTDRIVRQLETIRRAQNIVTRPPQVPAAPTPPRQVQTPPTPPRTQSPPPTPPKR
ncbi:MAG: hypothetical protein HZA30_01555 [Candidatus Omnitrophica bacterium]|nr:hypothetical protein [Candidatus Omnitrophota bacterium]